MCILLWVTHSIKVTWVKLIDRLFEFFMYFLFFSVYVLLVTERGVLKSPTITVYWTICPAAQSRFSPFQNFKAPSFFLLSYYFCIGGPLWHLQKFIQYIIVESPLHHSPFYLFPHSWNSFNRSHFSIFIHECINISTILLLYPFFISFLFPQVPIPRQELFYLPALWFWKKDIFICLR
jgi:hypothetical protein